MNLLIYDFKDFSLKEQLSIANFEIVLDTVITQTSTFIVNHSVVSAVINDIVILHERSFFYIGIIKEIDSSGITNKISCYEFKEILNKEVIEHSFNGNIGTHLMTLILNTLVRNSDSLQNLPYLKVSNKVSIEDNIVIEKLEVDTISSILKRLNKKYGIYIDTRLGFNNDNVQSGTITHIKLVITYVMNSTKLRSDLNLIRNLEVNIDKEALVNKIIFHNDGVTNPTTYYLTIDNLVTTNPSITERILPVNYKYVSFSENDDLYLKAEEELIKSEYNHYISFDIKTPNNIFEPRVNVSLGDEIEFIHKGVTYKTILSQIRYKDSLSECSIILGEHRVNLTDKLKLIGGFNNGFN
jgi:hypothetical protein